MRGERHGWSKESANAKVRRDWGNEAKKEMVRIVRSKDGDVSIDLTGKKRGAERILRLIKNAFYWRKRKMF